MSNGGVLTNAAQRSRPVEGKIGLSDGRVC